MAHEHDIDGEYLAPSDGAILDVYGAGDDLRLEVALPCPECDQPVEVVFESTGEVVESDIDFPLDDAEAALD
ncbi:MAG: hypothetical protein ABEJ85_00445 [Haloarculaceae archaeon]